MPKPSSYDLVLPALIMTSSTAKGGITSRSAGKTPAAAPPFFSSYLPAASGRLNNNMRLEGLT